MAVTVRGFPVDPAHGGSFPAVGVSEFIKRIGYREPAVVCTRGRAADPHQFGLRVKLTPQLLLKELRH